MKEKEPLKRSNISLSLVERVSAEQNYFQLNQNQIRALIAQMNAANCTLSTATPLVLHLDQFIDLCDRLKVDMHKLVDNRAQLQTPSLIDSSRFTLTPTQVAYMIKQAQYDFKTLTAIEQNLKKQEKKHQRFHLNSSQLVYLLANRRGILAQNVRGVSAAQLIGLYVLQRQIAKDEPTFSFSLTYEQIKQLALFQSNWLFQNS